MNQQLSSIDAIVADPAFGIGLNETLEHIRGYAMCSVLVSLMDMGILDRLEIGVTPEAISRDLGLDPHLLRGVFSYLAAERIVAQDGHGATAHFSLTQEGRRLQLYKGWYTMFVGGYRPIFERLDHVLRGGATSVARIGAKVGAGSCEISRYDTIPKTIEFIRKFNPDARVVADIGCGNAQYLCAIVELFDGIKGIGIEPNRGAYEEGLGLLAKNGLGSRIVLVNRDALSWQPNEPVDFLLFGFVLHELLGQSGEGELVAYLRALASRFCRSKFVIMEVDLCPDNGLMQTAYGRGYYNPYILLHSLTGQKLIARREWDRIFLTAGYNILTVEPTDPRIDPTGLGICYVIEPRAIA